MINQHPVVLNQANDARSRKKKVDLIDNTPLVCHWAGAVLVKKLVHELPIWSPGLDNTEIFPLNKTYLYSILRPWKVREITLGKSL